MTWKKIPPEAEYFHCEVGTDYFVCEEGFVIEGRYLQNDSPNLEKAIWPTVQGNRAYIRVRRKGVDKKFQLTRILIELFPELVGGEIQVRTRKGLFPLHIETGAQEAAPAAPARAAAPRPRKERHVHREKPEPEELVADVDSDAPADDEDDDDVMVPSAEVRLCKVCNLRKRVSEFSPRDDMCMDCYMGRDELLKEIIARRHRKTKAAAPRVIEESNDNASMDDGLDSFGRMDFGISLPD